MFEQKTILITIAGSSSAQASMLNNLQTENANEPLAEIVAEDIGSGPALNSQEMVMEICRDLT